MAAYNVTILTFDLTIAADTEQGARERAALYAGIGSRICPCGKSYWGDRGQEMHTGHGLYPTKDQALAYRKNLAKHNQELLERTELTRNN